MALKIFYVSSSSDPTVLVGLKVNIKGRTISWFDTVKERSMTASIIKKNEPEHIVFERSKDEGGGEYNFVPLTLEIYRQKVKPKLMSPKEFEKQEEMEKSFEATLEDVW